MADDARPDIDVLVRAHSRELYAYAYTLCRDRHGAQDLVQEVFLRAWRHLDNLREPRALRGWLYRILAREHARQYRSAWPRHEELEEASLPPVPGPDPADDIEVLRRAIDDLPLSYREPLLLQVLGGFDCQEIAGILGISPANVMARVSRARKKLRAMLREEPDRPAAREYTR